MIVFKPPVFYTHKCTCPQFLAHLTKDTSPCLSPVDTISVDINLWCCLLCNPLPLLLFSHALFMSIFQLFELSTLVAVVFSCLLYNYIQFSLILICCVLFYVLCIEVVSLMVRLLVFTKCLHLFIGVGWVQNDRCLGWKGQIKHWYT